MSRRVLSFPLPVETDKCVFPPFRIYDDIAIEGNCFFFHVLDGKRKPRLLHRYYYYISNRRKGRSLGISSEQSSSTPHSSLGMMANSISPNLILPPRQLSLFPPHRRSNDVHIDPKLPWVFHSGERKLYILRGHYLPRSISARADPIPTECTTTIPMQKENKKGEIHDNNNDDVIIWRRSNVSSGLQLTAFTIHIIMIINEMNEIATPKRINKDNTTSESK